MRLLFTMSLSCTLAAIAATQAFAQTSSCDGFIAHMQKALPELDAKFVKPVVVSRGAGPREDMRDMVLNLRIDGQLACDGDRFVRFEARIQEPSDAPLREGFVRVQQAAAIYKLRWSAPQAARELQTMASEAAEYLRGSAEREDHVVAGKVERHAGAAGDIGLIWTRTDRTFILVAYTP